MAEIRQLATSGKRIDEAVEAVENKSIYQAGNNVTIADGVISATDTTYEAGTGIDIANGKISVDDIPNVTLNTALSEEVIGWVEKGYPIYYTDVDYTFLYHFNTHNEENIYFTAVVPAAVDENNYPILIVATLIYNKQSKMFVYQTYEMVSTPSTSSAGFIKLGSNVMQTEPVQSETATVNRTYPVQVDVYGRAVVNVPWEGSSVDLATNSVAGAIKVASAPHDIQTITIIAAQNIGYGVERNEAGVAYVRIPASSNLAAGYTHLITVTLTSAVFTITVLKDNANAIDNVTKLGSFFNGIKYSDANAVVPVNGKFVSNNVTYDAVKMEVSGTNIILYGYDDSLNLVSSTLAVALATITDQITHISN